jgi:predicted RNA-binding protein (virulence factor B family)
MDCSLQPLGKQAKTRTAEQIILEALNVAGGRLAVTSKSDPEIIRSRFGLSKKQFKAGVQALIKEGKVRVDGGWLVVNE